MSSSRLWIYVGTYTHEESRGIYRCDFDLVTGLPTLGDVSMGEEVANPQWRGLAAEADQPSFLASHPTLPVIYCVNEVRDYEGEESGAVSAFRVEPDSGRLHLLGRRPSRGAAPCYLSVDPSGRCLLAANYGGGSVACFPLDPGGGLGEASSFFQHRGSSIHPIRQSAPHAHSIKCDPAGRFAFAPDLGQDRIVAYRLDTDGRRLVAADSLSIECTPGSGPRHMVFSQDGRFAYVICELSSTVTVFRYDSARGTLEPVQEISTLPEGFGGENTCGEVVLHPSGCLLYGANRGHDSIAVFAVDEENGILAPSGHQSTLGQWPRHFCITPGGDFLLTANQHSDTVTVFRIDANSGELRPRTESLSVPSPVCVLPMAPVEDSRLPVQ